MNNNINLYNQKFELNLFIKDLSTACADTVPIIVTIGLISSVAFLALGHMIDDLRALTGSDIKYELGLGLAIIGLGIFADSLRESYNKTRKSRIIEAFTSQRASFPDNTLPNMLVLTATHDHNGVLSIPDNLEIFLKLDKKFNIVFKKVALINDIAANLKENSVIKKIDVLWVRAHGNPSGITLSKSEGSKLEELTISNLNTVAAQIKTSLSPHGTIILFSCETAKKPDEYSESFAGALSSLSERKVVGPNQKLNRAVLRIIDPLEVKFLTIDRLSYQDCTVVINPSKKQREEQTLNM